MTKSPTIQSAVNDWLAVIKRAKSERTHITYASSARIFLASISDMIEPTAPAFELSELHFEAMIDNLKSGSASTERHHATVITMFFEFLSAKGYVSQANLMDSIRYMRRNETRKIPKRMRQMDFPAVTQVVHTVKDINPRGNVILARAKALVLLLAQSGLRGSEVVSLKVQDLDLNTMTGVVIGKGNKQAPFMLDLDSAKAINEYHKMRNEESDWLFLSHSNRDAKAPRPIEYGTAWRDVSMICDILLSEIPKYKITPHQFRHYLVTTIWRDTGDIESARLAARHESIATTKNYIHDDESDLVRLKKKMRG
jgi:integrase